jgi:hypothetical protein
MIWAQFNGCDAFPRYLRDLFIMACSSPVMFFLHRTHRLLLPTCLLAFVYPWFKNWCVRLYQRAQHAAAAAA